MITLLVLAYDTNQLDDFLFNHPGVRVKRIRANEPADLIGYRDAVLYVLPRCDERREDRIAVQEWMRRPGCTVQLVTEEQVYGRTKLVLPEDPRDHASRERFVESLAQVGEISRHHLLSKEPDAELPKIFEVAMKLGYTSVAATAEVMASERGLT